MSKIARRKPTVLERPESVFAMLAENRAEIDRVVTLPEAKDARKRADAIRSLAKISGQEHAIQNMAAENAIRARRRMGQLIPEVIDHGGDRKSSSHRVNLITLDDLGVERMDSHRCRLLAAFPTADFEAYIAAVLAKPEAELTTAGAIAAARLYLRQRDFLAKRGGIGGATVVQADAMDWLVVLPALSFDLLLTDPPYSTDVADLEAFVAGWLPLALQAVKPEGRAYICIGAYPHEVKTYLNELKRSAAWHCEDLLVWTFRNTLGPSGDGYAPNWQAILHLTTAATPPLTFESLTDRFAVLDIAAPDGRHEGRLHAWQKPDALAERLLKHAGVVKRVLDPFAGTGTFLVAAARHGADALGCEQDPEMLRWCSERGVHVVER